MAVVLIAPNDVRPGAWASELEARGVCRPRRPGRLAAPKSWTSDRERCRAAGAPDARAFATKTELARSLVVRALASPLPIAWVTADALYGQDWRFRRMLEEAGPGYVVAAPKSQQIKIRTPRNTLTAAEKDRGRTEVGEFP
ncbi:MULTISPECIES: transposase [unclassified Streptomyces]|uniref:transposase n=1 Tax=unclassified Streptomyces TaxID=2593676 RepID=UPI001CC2CB88|nr:MULTISPECIES: transposase [unclassified Streptomyces]